MFFPKVILKFSGLKAELSFTSIFFVYMLNPKIKKTCKNSLNSKFFFVFCKKLIERVKLRKQMIWSTKNRNL